MLHDDPCCYLCKGAHGICLTRGKCNHHIDARRRQDADDRARRLYRDPTGNQAVNNVMRATEKPRIGLATPAAPRPIPRRRSRGQKGQP